MEQKTERKHVWTNTAVVCLVALLCCFLWGSAFPGIKIGYGIFDISGSRPDYRSFLPEKPDFSWQESWRW